jgi:hypothetical protein
MKIRAWLIFTAFMLLLNIAYSEASYRDAEAACRDQAAQYTRADP